jgi:hypothetical protein
MLTTAACRRLRPASGSLERSGHLRLTRLLRETVQRVSRAHSYRYRGDAMCDECGTYEAQGLVVALHRIASMCWPHSHAACTRSPSFVWCGAHVRRSALACVCWTLTAFRTRNTTHHFIMTFNMKHALACVRECQHIAMPLCTNGQPRSSAGVLEPPLPFAFGHG